jgi:molybdopterin-guanine dinucleotide biosynthesis protein A
LDREIVQVSGLVLCGGASARMGTDKALLAVGDETLIERALRIVAAVASDVRLACGSEARYAALGVPLVRDHFPGAGPLAGLEAGLSAAPAGLVVALACDMPFADASVLSALAEHARVHDLDVVALRSERGVEPLCAVWSTSLAPAMRAALESGERSVQRFLAGLAGAAVLDAAAIRGGSTAAVNVNTPADLEHARAITAAGTGSADARRETGT